MTGKSIGLFIAAIAEIGGAYLVWIGLRDHKGALFVVLGILALGLYGVVATLRPSNEFGLVLAAYGSDFIVGSIAWRHGLRRLPPRPLRPARRHDLPRRNRVITYAPR